MILLFILQSKNSKIDQLQSNKINNTKILTFPLTFLFTIVNFCYSYLLLEVKRLLVMNSLKLLDRKLSCMCTRLNCQHPSLPQNEMNFQFIAFIINSFQVTN